MKDSHRISVRFDLSDPIQRKVYEALHEIDRTKNPGFLTRVFSLLKMPKIQ